jgi:hypothetical protein
MEINTIFQKIRFLMGSVLGDGRILFDTCGYSLIFFGEVNFSDFLVEKIERILNIRPNI